MRGRFVTLEGGEGAGKSTQVRLLVEALDRSGIDAIATREPGGSPGAEEIRRLFVGGDPGRWDPVAEALLVSAARRDHLLRTIWPALDAGKWVVSDRFADSTIAYQGSAGGVARAELDALYRLVAGDFRPDLTLILDLPVELGLARAGARGGDDRFEKKERAFHERLRAGFLAIAAEEPERCAVIDASGSPEEVHEAIWQVVRARLG
ncbi:MAG: dTMP kinase [Rhodospirillales bacterium]|nr:dTMP kinase [Rhodospirillales bacterium]